MRALSIAFLLIAQFGLAQVFHFPDTSVTFIKSTDFGTVHGYLEVINDSGDSIPMRWVSRIDTQCPPQWYFNFDDQNNFYAPVQHLDTGYFTLYPTGTFPQKMIIGLAHNNAPDSGSIRFTISTQANPLDSALIRYEFLIAKGTKNDTTDTTSGIPATTGQSAQWWRLNGEHIEITSRIEKLEIFTTEGRLVRRYTLLRNDDHIALPAVGFYVVSAQSGRDVRIQRIARTE